MVDHPSRRETTLPQTRAGGVPQLKTGVACQEEHLKQRMV